MTVSNWKMIEAVMYGIMPSPKTVNFRRLAPANKSARARAEPEFALKYCASASALMPGVGMNAPRRYTASSPSVNSTRLRRSGMRKMLAIFSNIKTSGLARKPAVAGSSFIGLNLYRSRNERTDALAKSLSDQNRLAPSFFNSFLGSPGKLMRMNRHRAGQLAVVQNLDQPALLAQQAERDDLVERELGAGSSPQNLGDAVQAKDRVLGAEDVVEAAFGQAAVQRHLTAFEAAHQRRAGTRTLALVAACGSLAHARAHTAADTLLVFVRLLGGAQIGEIADCHFVLPRYNAGSWPARMGCSLFAAQNVIRRHARDGAPWPPCRGSTACLRARQSG